MTTNEEKLFKFLNRLKEEGHPYTVPVYLPILKYVTDEPEPLPSPKGTISAESMFNAAFYTETQSPNSNDDVPDQSTVQF